MSPRIFLFCSILALGISVPGTGNAKMPHGVKVVSGESEFANSWSTVGSTPLTLELAPGATIALSPGAQFGFAKSLKLALGKRGAKVRTFVIRLKEGRVDVRLPADGHKQAAVLVRGPSQLSAVTKKGHGVVTVRDGKVTAAAYTGEMLIAYRSRWKDLKEGKARTGAAGRGYGAERAVLGRPTAPKLAHALRVALKKGSSSSAVSTTPLTDAARYFFELRKQGTLITTLETTEPKAQLTGITPGVYTVTVQGMDSSGLRGPTSPASSFRVLGVKLPEGSYFAKDGTILLKRYQSSEFIGIEGLEAGFGRYPYFAPAAPRIGLARHKATTLTLRDPVTKEEVHIEMAPRTISAQVEFKNNNGFFWPSSGLRLKISLKDESGRPVPSDLKFDTAVTVNVKAIQPKWQGRGATRYTTLRTPKGAGPWLIRVNVKDQWGGALGRELIELRRPTGARAASVSRARKVRKAPEKRYAKR